MRKHLILTGLVLWLIFIAAAILIIFNKGDLNSAGNAPVLMLGESETTEMSEPAAAPTERKSEATMPEIEITTEPEKTVFATGPESTEPKAEEVEVSAETEKVLPSEKIAPTGASSQESENGTEPVNTLPPKNTVSIPEETTIPTEPEQTIEANTASTFSTCEVSTNEISHFRYWLYTPSNPTDNMPLIVYLHGGSGKGDDLNLITSVDGFPQYLQSGALGNVRAYVVIPQLPSNQRGWAGIHGSLYSLIESIVSEYSLNAGNISLTGHSMGGTGTWSFAAAYPTLFARIAPLSGSMRSTTDVAAQLKNISVWAFVGSADTIVPPESSEEVVALLQESGGNAKITVFDGADHFTVPSLSYLDETIGLLGWLIG